jgi:hypothetical protein
MQAPRKIRASNHRPEPGGLSRYLPDGAALNKLGIGIAAAALFAWSQAVTPLQATIASSSINPADVMATYKAPLPIEQWDAI